MSDAKHVLAARERAKAARARLTATLGEIQARLAPKTIVRDAVDNLRENASAFAGDTVAAVRSRPIAATAIAAGIGLLLARKPILRAAKRFSDGDETAAPADGSGAEPLRNVAPVPGVTDKEIEA